jgi:hypothetical protein
LGDVVAGVSFGVVREGREQREGGGGGGKV